MFSVKLFYDLCLGDHRPLALSVLSCFYNVTLVAFSERLGNVSLGNYKLLVWVVGKRGRIPA